MSNCGTQHQCICSLAQLCKCRGKHSILHLCSRLMQNFNRLFSLEISWLFNDGPLLLSMFVCIKEFLLKIFFFSLQRRQTFFSAREYSIHVAYNCKTVNETYIDMILYVLSHITYYMAIDLIQTFMV